MNEKWAPFYYGTHIGVAGDIEFYIDALSSPSKILELGCGTGRLTEHLLRSGHKVVAVDRSEYAIKAVEALAAGSQTDDELSVIRGDFQIKIPNRLTVKLSIEPKLSTFFTDEYTLFDRNHYFQNH